MLLPKKDKGDSRNLNSRASSHIIISYKKYLGKKKSYDESLSH